MNRAEQITNIINSLYVLMDIREEHPVYVENFQDHRFLPVSTYTVWIKGKEWNLSVFSLYRARLAEKYFPHYVKVPLANVLNSHDVTEWEPTENLLKILG